MSKSEVEGEGGLGRKPFYMTFNFVSSVCIIFTNKVIGKALGFRYFTFLTALHFIITYLGLVICARLRVFTPVPVKMRDVFPLAVTFCGFVVFNNLSLLHNSVGFYQLCKILTTPVIAVIQYFTYGVTLQWQLVLTLIPTIAGVFVANANDMEFNVMGTVFAGLGIVSTSMYQLLVKSKQQDLKTPKGEKINSFQLLYHQAPLSALMVLSVCPFFDDLWSEQGLYNYVWTQETVVLILISCCLAFCVNLSIFLVIGKTSPISYNVLGHFKMVLIFVGGFLWLHEDANNKRVAGTVLASIGIASYAYLKLYLENRWDLRNTPRHKDIESGKR